MACGVFPAGRPLVSQVETMHPETKRPQNEAWGRSSRFPVLAFREEPLPQRPSAELRSSERSRELLAWLLSAGLTEDQARAEAARLMAGDVWGG
ncbi:hypothetical protein CGQ25_16925 [Sinomonas sp. R1AF57]|nr:hypothetical protein CGQ25_16925 [Sinomonas sp. R1AF57]